MLTNLFRHLMASIVGAMIGSAIYNILIAMLSIASIWSGLPRLFLLSLPIVIAVAVTFGAVAWILAPSMKSRTVGVVAAISIVVSFLGGFTLAAQMASREIPIQELGGTFSDYTIYTRSSSYYLYRYVGQFISGLVTAVLCLIIIRLQQRVSSNA